MKRFLKIGAAASALALLAFVTVKGIAPSPALAEGESFNEGQVKSIEKIVKDYLIAHPEVLLEVQEAYEKKLEAARSEASRSRMPDFYKALASMKTELAPFSVGEGDVTMIEFFDYNCGYCRQTLPELIKLIDSDKRVKVLFIEFPILSPGSTEATKVAIAAAKQGKYFEFHKAMLSAGHASKDSALKIAEKIGLDINKVKQDMASPETEALLAKFTELARRMFIDGTPSFIVGDKANPGAVDAEQLKQLVEETRKSGCKACVTDASTPAGGAKEEKKS
jgi:protein-disulfide isomerase